MGMNDQDEYAAVCLNAEPDGIESLRNAQDDDIIFEVKKFVRIPHAFPESWYVNNSN